MSDSRKTKTESFYLTFNEGHLFLFIHYTVENANSEEAPVMKVCVLHGIFQPFMVEMFRNTRLILAIVFTVHSVINIKINGKIDHDQGKPWKQWFLTSELQSWCKIFFDKIKSICSVSFSWYRSNSGEKCMLNWLNTEFHRWIFWKAVTCLALKTLGADIGFRSQMIDVALKWLFIWSLRKSRKR